MELLAIGTSAFLPGFALAGVKTVLATSAQSALSHARAAPKGTLLIIEESLVKDVAPQDRAWLETNTDPIIITISADDTAQADRMRRAIRGTLGVDLMAKG